MALTCVKGAFRRFFAPGWEGRDAVQMLGIHADAYRKDIAAFIKLPDWFEIPTPIGNYVPDLGVVRDEADGRRYRVCEVKGTTSTGTDDATPEAKRKTRCARRHFEALDTGVDFAVVTDARAV